MVRIIASTGRAWGVVLGSFILMGWDCSREFDFNEECLWVEVPFHLYVFVEDLDGTNGLDSMTLAIPGNPTISARSCWDIK